MSVKLLVLIHVLSAIIGVGPTFYGHVLLRKKQSLDELRHSLKQAKLLEYFPKIGGTIAILTGLILFFVGEYGSFMQLWLLGSLILYIIIQVTVIGFVAPNSAKLGQWVFDPVNQGTAELPPLQQKMLSKVGNLYNVASALGILLFIFMIIKPGL
jgi:uncharacterized membrane protein SirB2